MARRMAAAFLWYAMVWVGYEIAWSVTGIPRMIGPVVAAGVAVFVSVDPFHRFWTRLEKSPSRQHPAPVVPDVTAERPTPSAR
jgi:hypothetical protein